MKCNKSLICSPVIAPTVNEMLTLIYKAKNCGADLVEIRLDYLTNFHPNRDLSFLILHSPLPTLFTYRPKWEGGEYKGDDGYRLHVLRLAMEQGADYVDIELELAEEFNKSVTGKKPKKLKVIVSSHNYECTPEIKDIHNLVAKVEATGADIVKIATTAEDITDVARIFKITINSQVPMIGLGMGEKGLISRILCPKFGGYLTFGTIEKGKMSAPWEPTVDELLNLYNFRRIGPETKVYGVIGNPVANSKSPIIFNKAFKLDGVNGVFVRFLVDKPRNFFSAYSFSDFAGFTCTIPHKEAVLQCCDDVDRVAKCIGAVNTIVKVADGKLMGYNTDYIGAVTAIENGLRGANIDYGTGSPLADRLVVVIGAGGAAKAIAYGVRERGARVVIANRLYDRANEVANCVGGIAISLCEIESFYPEGSMILANATSIGMHPNVHETPVPQHVLRHYSLVFDAVYTPKITKLLRQAEEVGAIAVSGVDMFIGQAFEQYTRFTGLPARDEQFRKLLVDY